MYIYIYVYTYIYMVIIKHSFPIMVAHATITTVYIIVIEVSCMHLLCAIYQNQKGVWLVVFLTNFNIRPKLLING